MGFFSWKTSDTKRSIANHYSSRPTFTVYMITRDGQVYTEDSYDGYGKFGGKDFYELTAELNGSATREDGIRLELGITYITNGDVKYCANGVDFVFWDKPIHEGKSPNELLEQGWTKGHEFKGNLNLPKLVESLPSDADWAEYFDRLPASENCDYQGFFYS